MFVGAGEQRNQTSLPWEEIRSCCGHGAEPKSAAGDTVSPWHGVVLLQGLKPHPLHPLCPFAGCSSSAGETPSMPAWGASWSPNPQEQPLGASLFLPLSREMGIAYSLI